MLDKNIVKYRHQCGLSQSELANELNVVRQTVSKWETGLSAPDAELLVKLSEVLGVSVGELVGEQQRAVADEKPDGDVWAKTALATVAFALAVGVLIYCPWWRRHHHRSGFYCACSIARAVCI